MRLDLLRFITLSEADVYADTTFFIRCGIDNGLIHESLKYEIEV